MPPQDAETAEWIERHIKPHEAMLRAWLASRFPFFPEIDDVIQEAYARLISVRVRSEVRQPKAFFFATARNLALDYLRRRRISPVQFMQGWDDLPLLDESADVVENVARNQEIELMTKSILALPDRCRQVMTLRYVYSLSQKEVATHLGISVRTVEAQVTIGIKRCTDFVRRQSSL